MGGGGKKSGINGGSSAPSGPPALDPELIRRANDAGAVFDLGDGTARQYHRNTEEISNMDLTDDEKQSAYTQLHALTEEQLKAEGEARSPYGMGMGPARFNKNKLDKASNKAAKARQNTENFMKGLRDEQKSKVRARKAAELNAAMKKAMADGALSFEYDGHIWRRNSKRSRTFTQHWGE